MFRAVVVLVFAVAYSQGTFYCGSSDPELNAHEINLVAGQNETFVSATPGSEGWKEEALSRAGDKKIPLCSWSILGQGDGTRVAIAFVDFTLPPPQRNNTALQIYDGKDDSAPELEPDEHRNCYSPHGRVGLTGRGFCDAVKPKAGHFFVSSGAGVHVALRTMEPWQEKWKIRFKVFAFRPIDGITSDALRSLPFDLALPCQTPAPPSNAVGRDLTFETLEPTYTTECTGSAPILAPVPKGGGGKCESFVMEPHTGAATSDTIVWPLQNDNVDTRIPEALAVAKLDGNEQIPEDQRHIIVVRGRIFMNTAWSATGSARAPRLMLKPKSPFTPDPPAVQIWPRNGTTDPTLPPSGEECNNGWIP